MMLKRSLTGLGLLLAGALVGLAQQQGVPPALASLVESERAFARTSVARGVRESFLAFFADDGINFQPHPTKTREAFLKRPAPTAPQPFTLDWYPVYADIARAGDLGYTTGPFTLTDHSPEHRPTRHGYFFSVWQKQADGAWKVVLDLGIGTPAPPDGTPAPQFHAPRKIGGDAPTAKLSPEAAQGALRAADEALLQAEAARGLAEALPAAMTDEGRFHRDGVFPVVGRREVAKYLAGKSLVVTGTPLKAVVAQSGDLGYTYGSYEQKDGARVEKGYYVRVWKLVGDRWRVALDTTNPLPAETK
ncbi:MAG TPA: nuclear transport factor 2 family protein [Pyrinomonadaceae bacterium]|jgi:ketosteroid isomerase-like protein